MVLRLHRKIFSLWKMQLNSQVVWNLFSITPPQDVYILICVNIQTGKVTKAYKLML